MTDLNVFELGDPASPPLVLVHGLTDDGTCWPDAVARWGARWRILAVDQRGHGASPRFTAAQLETSPSVLEADLVAVLQAIGEPAVVVGHSLGGLIAARAAQKHPELVAALVLEDPAKPDDDWQPRTEFVSAQLEFVGKVTDDPDGEIARMRGETDWSDAELAAWALAKAKVDRNYLRGGLFLGGRVWEGLFQVLEVPTLIVVPVDGPMAPDPRLIRNDLVQVVEVPQAGHCVRRDNPEGYHGVVDPFLDEHRREAAG